MKVKYFREKTINLCEYKVCLEALSKYKTFYLKRVENKQLSLSSDLFIQFNMISLLFRFRKKRNN